MEIVKENSTADKPTENKNANKLEYDDLLNVAQQLSGQVQELQLRLRQSDMNATFRRLDYLFDVVQYKNKGVFKPDFVKDCAAEIEGLIYPEDFNKTEEVESKK